MPKRSAGLILYRRSGPVTELLLVHPGGPFWARKDAGFWSIPKGEYVEGEDALTAALREFQEETGTRPPDGPTLSLGEAVQRSRKVVTAFAREGDLDPVAVCSNLVEIEWPPRSGRRLAVPEIDRAEWFAPDRARGKLLAGHRVFVDRLCACLAEV